VEKYGADKCEVVDIWEVSDLSTKEVIRFNELKRILLGINSTVLSE
jgi:DNA-binding HxlR family transcriptional regulator